MTENIDHAYRMARRVSVLGAVFMYCCAAFCGIIFIVSAWLSVTGGYPSGVPGYERLVAPVASLASALAVVCLGRFLHKFTRGETPFGNEQTRRLLVASLLLLLKLLLEAIFPTPLYKASIAPDSTVALTTYPGLSLMTVVVAVFLLCLAIIVRYGNALKDDSDSIA